MWLAYCLLIYIILISYMFGIVGNSSNVPRSYNCLFLFLFFFPLGILGMFRAINVGSDTVTYYRAYNVITNSDLYTSFLYHGRMEQGHVLFMKFCSKLGLTAAQFVGTCSFLTLTTIAIYFYKNSKCLFISCFSFFSLCFFDGSCNIVRQYLALTILLFSVRYIFKRNLLLFLAIVILASTFHKTAVIFLIVYPLYNVELSRKNIWYLMLFTIAFAICGMLFLNHFLELLIGNDWYGGYAKSHYVTQGVRFGSFINIFIQMLYSVICLYAYHLYGDQFSKEEKFFQWLSLISLSIECCTLPVNVMERLGLYFHFFSLIAIADALYYFKKNNYYISYYVMLLMLVGCTNYIIVHLFRPTWTSFYPYSFCFDT